MRKALYNHRFCLNSAFPKYMAVHSTAKVRKRKAANNLKGRCMSSLKLSRLDMQLKKMKKM
jgi:hypothetical protein